MSDVTNGVLVVHLKGTSPVLKQYMHLYQGLTLIALTLLLLYQINHLLQEHQGMLGQSPVLPLQG